MYAVRSIECLLLVPFIRVSSINQMIKAKQQLAFVAAVLNVILTHLISQRKVLGI